MRERLRRVSDLERLAGRVALARAHPRDLRAIAESVRAAEDIARVLGDGGVDALAAPLASAAAAVVQVAALVDEALVNEPPLSINDGGIIRSGYDDELDRVRGIAEDAETLLRAYLEEERGRSGIATLRLRHNRVLGRYLEVTRAQAARVPSHFIRRQSLVGGERFTTERLAQLDSEISAASEQLRGLERDRFLALREQVTGSVPAILALGRNLAGVDMAHSLALAAAAGGYTRPELAAAGSGIDIREGRHPVVEAMLPSGAFVPNELRLDPAATRFVLLTGPNMAGKSTYLRQTALIVLLAQIGSFVPAAEARIGIVDGIFCRVGASDNLARGESTFLVEMNETARILRAATQHSFIILDEIGRGTSTEDGRAIAWAVCEHLLEVVGAQTLFATHLRELTEIRHPHAANFSMQVEDDGGEVVFLKRVEPGAADQSYGVHVAALAGVPEAVVARARVLLDELSTPVGGAARAGAADSSPAYRSPAEAQAVADGPGFRQGVLFSPHELVGRAVAALDVDATTPLSALQLLAQWQRELRGEGP